MVAAFPTDAEVRGGVESVAWSLSMGLQELGVRVTVLDPRPGIFSDQRYAVGRVDVRRIGIGGAYGRSQRVKKAVENLAASLKIDLVHGQGIARFIPQQLLSVYTLHGILEDEIWTEPSRVRSSMKALSVVPQELRARKSMKNVIAISSFNEKYFSPASQRIWRIPNPVAPVFIEMANNVGKGGAPRLIFVGSLRARKRVRELIRAFAQADPKGHSTLAIAGAGIEGRYGQACRSDAVALGLGNRITWLGSLTPREVAHEMTKSRALILPSSVEAAPMVIAEAFTVGLPVVAADVGGIKDMVSDRVNGLVFRSDDDGSAMVSAIRETLKWSDPAKWRVAARAASRPYNYRVVARATADVYQEVVRQG